MQTFAPNLYIILKRYRMQGGKFFVLLPLT